MLALHYYTGTAWHQLGQPYPVGDAMRVQRASAELAQQLGLVLRVVGSGGQVLTLWDGRRWHMPAETTTAPAGFWQQDNSDYPSTVPLGAG